MGETSGAPVAEKKPLQVELDWQGDLRFRGQSGDVVLDMDSDAKAGVSPMQALAFGLAGCMGMDLVHILTKARFELRSVKASLTGRRPQDPPSRFIAVTLHFAIAGNPPDDQVQRAIQLSRDKYCSVWNSMRQDIDFVVTFAVDRS